jgi:hypothetical protein
MVRKPSPLVHLRVQKTKGLTPSKRGKPKVELNLNTSTHKKDEKLQDIVQANQNHHSALRYRQASINSVDKNEDTDSENKILTESKNSWKSTRHLNSKLSKNQLPRVPTSQLTE